MYQDRTESRQRIVRLIVHRKIPIRFNNGEDKMSNRIINFIANKKSWKSSGESSDLFQRIRSDLRREFYIDERFIPLPKGLNKYYSLSTSS